MCVAQVTSVANFKAVVEVTEVVAIEAVAEVTAVSEVTATVEVTILRGHKVYRKRNVNISCSLHRISNYGRICSHNRMEGLHGNNVVLRSSLVYLTLDDCYKICSKQH